MMRLVPTTRLALGVAAVLGLALVRPASAVELVTNGGFESGITGWTVLDQPGGSGAWFLQTGTGSPVNLFSVPAPPEGAMAAMTDQSGPGSHVLYQDFVVPSDVLSATLSFQAFVLNSATAYVSPDSLDYTVGSNQQARVDIIKTTADPFSVLPADVLQNVFQTLPGDPFTSGYSLESADLTALLLAHPGETLRLRFAEADNLLFFNFGVDAVGLAVTTGVVPEPGSLALLLCGGASGLLLLRRRR